MIEWLSGGLFIIGATLALLAAVGVLRMPDVFTVSDRIVVLRRGEVLEHGSHDELMQKQGAYSGMYKAFTSGVLTDDIG